MLIASRRQIDAAEFGGGYVGAHAAQPRRARRARDARPDRALSRPRRPVAGHPPRRPRRSGRWTRRASRSSPTRRGLHLLHIDTSTSPAGDRSRRPRARLLVLYDECWRQAVSAAATRSPSRSATRSRHVVEGLDRPRRCSRHSPSTRESTGAPDPLFVVVQTGTKVMERRNVGSLDGALPHRGADALRRSTSRS